MATRLNHLANVIVSQLNTTIVMLGSFVVTPAILYGLGDDAYGGWLLINSFIHYMRFLELGMSGGTVKYGAAAIEKGDDAELAKVLNTSSVVFCALGTIGLVATLGLSFVLPRIYPTIAAGQTATILMLGGAISLELACKPFSSTLRMRSLFYIHDGIEIVAYSVFKLGLVLFFAYRKELSYQMLAMLTLGEVIMKMGLVTVISIARYPSSRKINPFRAERKFVKSLATMGTAITIISVADIVRFQLDAAIIGYFKPDEPIAISIFGVGIRLPSVAYASIGVIGAVLMPKFSGLSAVGDTKQLLTLLRRASLSTGLVASLVLVNLAVLGPHFLELWLKKPWVTTSGTILLMMLPAYFVALMAGPSQMLLVGRAQLRGLATLTVVEALVNLGLTVALIRPFGIFGVALGTGIPLAFFRGVVFPFVLKREVGITPVEYYKMYGRALGIGAVYLVLVSPLSLIALTSYVRFVLLGLASVAVFAVLVLGLVPEARTAVVERVRRRLGKGEPADSASA